MPQIDSTGSNAQVKTESKLHIYDIEHHSRPVNKMAVIRYTPVMRTCLSYCRNPTSSTTASTTPIATATSAATAPSMPTATVVRTNAITSSSRSSFSTSTQLRGGGSHENHYNPPTGWLWGIPPGQKYEKEGWEGLMYWGFCGSIGLAAIAYIYKPDSRFVSFRCSFYSLCMHTKSYVAPKWLSCRKLYPLGNFCAKMISPCRSIYFRRADVFELVYKLGPWKKHDGD